MLAAAEQRPDTELHDSGLQRIPKTRQPTCAATAGHDVRFLYDLAECAEIRQHVCQHRSAPDNRQAHPRPPRERGKRRGAIQLLKNPQEPIRRQLGEAPMMLRGGEDSGRCPHGLKEVHGYEKAEGRQLQE